MNWVLVHLLTEAKWLPGFEIIMKISAKAPQCFSVTEAIYDSLSTKEQLTLVKTLLSLRKDLSQDVQKALDASFK